MEPVYKYSSNAVELTQAQFLCINIHKNCLGPLNIKQLPVKCESRQCYLPLLEFHFNFYSATSFISLSSFRQPQSNAANFLHYSNYHQVMAISVCVCVCV